jgi:hypothetical protein
VPGDRAGEGKVNRFEEAARRSLAKSREVAGGLERHGGPAMPGDLFVCAAARDFPVEWLVLERDPGRPGSLLAILADTQPLLGAPDLAVPAAAEAGPLSLRCRYGLWLAESDLDPALRTGRVAPELAGQALRRYRELAAGGPPLEEAGDEADPEYEDWVEEVLVPAHAALAGRESLPAPAPWRPPAKAVWYPLAASILLLIAAGLAGVVGWQQQKIQRLAGDLRREQARSERPPASGGRLDQPLANLPFVWLQPRESLRGRLPAIRRPGGAPFLLVVLQLGESDTAPEYRLEVARAGEPGAIWSVSGLRKTGLAELSVALPGPLLAPGDYRLRLYRQQAGSTSPVHEYEVAVGSR